MWYKRGITVTDVRPVRTEPGRAWTSSTVKRTSSEQLKQLTVWVKKSPSEQISHGKLTWHDFNGFPAIAPPPDCNEQLIMLISKKTLKSWRRCSWNWNEALIPAYWCELKLKHRGSGVTKARMNSSHSQQAAKWCLSIEMFRPSASDTLQGSVGFGSPLLVLLKSKRTAKTGENG